MHLRICQLIESTSGGSVRVALDLTQGLLVNGDDVVFIYSPLRADKRFFEESNKMREARFVSLPIQNSLCLSDALSLIKLIRFLSKTGPYDVLHAHSSKAGGIARLAAMFFPRMAVVYSPHAFVTMAPGSSFVFKILEKALSWRTDAIIAVSQKEKEHAIERLGIKSEKVFVVPNSAPQISTGDKGVRPNPDIITLGFVGRLAKQKNIERLLLAFHLSLKQNKGLKLLIVGDGPEKDKLKALMKELTEESFVQCVGAQEAGPYYSLMDALICSSDYEGFPLVFLEALSHGVPIISTPVGGTDEAIVQGQTGLVCADFSPESLSEAINLFLANFPKERDQNAEKCKAHATTFSRERMINTVRGIYKDIVSRRKGTV